MFGIADEVANNASLAPCDIGVAVYHPDLDLLVDLVTVASRDNIKVWLFLNAPLTPEAKDRLLRAAPFGLAFIDDGTNLGLGVAYNRMARAARDAGARMLLIFDQDSVSKPGFAANLRATFERLRAAGETPALVGPLPVSNDSEAFKAPRVFPHRTARFGGTTWPAEFVISSGSLLDLAVLEMIGPFREDFFIDAVDIEWCFRCWASRYSCWIDSSVSMPHRLGQGVVGLPFLNIRFARQPPARLYTYVRNQIAMLSLPHVPRSWKLRILPHLLVQFAFYLVTSNGDRRKILRAFSYGLADGLWSRLGHGRRDEFL